MLGAILTQNTAWRNVETAIANLKERGLLSVAALASARKNTLASLMRPAGYYNVKADRVRNYFRWFLAEIGPDASHAQNFATGVLRRRMLAEISGTGPETADSILLYALDRPVFVIDAYTRRILSRHGVKAAGSMKYDELRLAFQSALPRHTGLFNEYHALLVRCGKLCNTRAPSCSACPLDGLAVKL
ncbi:MAG: endonuclease III domain-containing protein [Planctomycetes bacterium]|nr:endonuclease III domain-containing protein [Planctomycetota bacterium]